MIDRVQPRLRWPLQHDYIEYACAGVRLFGIGALRLLPILVGALNILNYPLVPKHITYTNSHARALARVFIKRISRKNPPLD